MQACPSTTSSAGVREPSTCIIETANSQRGGVDILRIYKEKAGVVSKKPVWVIIEDMYLYTHKTLMGVIWLFVRCLGPIILSRSGI